MRSHDWQHSHKSRKQGGGGACSVLITIVYVPLNLDARFIKYCDKCPYCSLQTLEKYTLEFPLKINYFLLFSGVCIKKIDFYSLDYRGPETKTLKVQVPFKKSDTLLTMKCKYKEKEGSCFDSFQLSDANLLMIRHPLIYISHSVTSMQPKEMPQLTTFKYRTSMQL